MAFNSGTKVVSVLRNNQIYSSVKTLKTTIIWKTTNMKTWKLTNVSYVYWTVHHLTSWINWTNLMSLYESFLLLNMFRMLLHSSSGAGDYMWVCCTVSVCTAPTCIRIPPYSSRTAPIHRYTPKQSNTPTYSRQLLRMSVLALETGWAIKNFHEVTPSWFNLFN